MYVSNVRGSRDAVVPVPALRELSNLRTSLCRYRGCFTSVFRTGFETGGEDGIRIVFLKGDP